jgi:EAL domain-containing protein (putative c-di-GMP-specific phosphodiesterase class I)/CheY-like chemotaxis protein
MPGFQWSDAMSDRLLVIDDEREFSGFVRRVAELSGYQVRTTTDPAEFRAWSRDWQPTHIFLDLVMPEVDGVEMLRFLAGDLSAARIVIMSGFDARVVEAARRIGTERGLDIAATVQKPLRAAELRQLLESLHTDEDTVSESALCDALTNGEIRPYYQPKVDLQTWSPVGFEALVRWRHAVRGTLPPDKFVPVAEASGHIDQLSDTVADQAVRQIGEWRGDGIDACVAINLSGLNLHEEALADRLDALCRKYGVPRDRVTFEVTETAAMSQPLRALDILTRLRIKGFKLAIDDFGTGYSSLVQLHRMPFCELKIDKSFVQECDRSREARVIVKTIIDLGHNLNMSVVAEGAESQEVLHTLAGLGCDVVQGYALGRPMEATAAAAWLSEWTATH